MKFFRHVFICLLIIIILIVLSIHVFQQNIIEGATTSGSSRLVLSSNPYTPITSCPTGSQSYTVQSSNFYFYNTNNTSASPKFFPIFFLQNSYDINILRNIFLDNRQYNIDCDNVLYFINSNSKNYWYQSNNISSRIKCYLNKSGTFIECWKYLNEQFTSTTPIIQKPNVGDTTIRYNSYYNDKSNGLLKITFKNDTADPNYNVGFIINIGKNSNGTLNKFENKLLNYFVRKNIINRRFDRTTVKFIRLTYNTSKQLYTLFCYNDSSEIIRYTDFEISDLSDKMFGLFSNTYSIEDEIASIYNVNEPSTPLYLINANNNNRFSCGYIEDSNKNKSYPFICQKVQ